MILQYIAENRRHENMLYVSADNMYFATHSIVELADNFSKENGKHIFIDEVHKYKNWSRELKQIHDVHADMKITFSGSSILDIQKGEADLSRRALMYEMQGLSFREYLKIFHNIDSQQYSLDEILQQKVELPQIPHPLPYFREYLKHGYFPFSQEDGFSLRIEQIITQTIESDIAQFADLKAITARKLKQLLGVISSLSPYKPNIDNLAKELNISKNNIPDYLVYLERAGMIGLLRDNTGGLRGIGKIEKVYVDNPNLMAILTNGTPDIGNLRETFFYNQLRVKNHIMASRQSDFCIDQYTFEIGGHKKGKKQIEDIADGYIVRDDIEFGHSNIIPLWHFGFNY